MSRFIVVGSKAGELDGEAASAIARADVVYGPERARAAVGDDRFHPWPDRFADVLTAFDQTHANGKPVIGVVASGDPLHFGIGGTLVRRYGAAAVHVVPAPSSFARAAARLGWPQDEVGCLSLHGTAATGREVAALRQWVVPRRRLLVLSRDGDTPGQIARLLSEMGFGRSRLTVIEAMDGPGERSREAVADAFALSGIDALNVVAINCVAGPDATWHPLVGGLPDDTFANDGQLTKADVRALTVARLRPRPGGVMWDVGAGCGSVGLEWLRASSGGELVAVERSPSRCELIRTNLSHFGLGGVSVVEGAVPDALADQPTPDVVFIGGGLSDPAVFGACWRALQPGGTLGANVVTLEGEAAVAELHAAHGGRLVRLTVSEAEAIGPFRGWRSAMPVTMWTVEKRA